MTPFPVYHPCWQVPSTSRTWTTAGTGASAGPSGERGRADRRLQLATVRRRPGRAERGDPGAGAGPDPPRGVAGRGVDPGRARRDMVGVRPEAAVRLAVV